MYIYTYNIKIIIEPNKSVSLKEWFILKACFI